MKYNLIDPSNAVHYMWGKNCDSWVLLDSETLSVKQEAMPACTRETLHLHLLSQQMFYILKGAATFLIDDEKVFVNSGQAIHIPAGTQHFISNDSDTILSFLVISQPSTNNDREDLL